MKRVAFIIECSIFSDTICSGLLRTSVKWLNVFSTEDLLLEIYNKQCYTHPNSGNLGFYDNKIFNISIKFYCNILLIIFSISYYLFYFCVKKNYFDFDIFYLKKINKETFVKFIQIWDFNLTIILHTILVNF